VHKEQIVVAVAEGSRRGRSSRVRPSCEIQQQHGSAGVADLDNPFRLAHGVIEKIIGRGIERLQEIAAARPIPATLFALAADLTRRVYTQRENPQGLEE
jgi:hypothetical protein